MLLDAFYNFREYGSVYDCHWVRNDLDVFRYGRILVACTVRKEFLDFLHEGGKFLFHRSVFVDFHQALKKPKAYKFSGSKNKLVRPEIFIRKIVSASGFCHVRFNWSVKFFLEVTYVPVDGNPADLEILFNPEFFHKVICIWQVVFPYELNNLLKFPVGVPFFHVSPFA